MTNEKIMLKPFLTRFAEAEDAPPMPLMRRHPVTQISEIFRDGKWQSALEIDRVRGGNGTKTAVHSETTDHR
jgi:hypothetical protein